MARYIFHHLGSRPFITPDLPSKDAVENWAQARFDYDDQSFWADISELEDLPLPIAFGDPELDWPVRRELNGEDWYAGPIEVLDTASSVEPKGPLTHCACSGLGVGLSCPNHPDDV